jgi:hypothetical protein
MGDYVVVIRETVVRDLYHHVTECDSAEEAVRIASECETEDCSEEDIVDSCIRSVAMYEPEIDTGGIECSQLAEREMSRKECTVEGM